MKKSVKLKRKTKRLLIKNLIVFVVLIAVSFVGVRSWLIDRNHADAKGIQANCTIPDDVEVAVVKPGTIPAANAWVRATEIELNGDNFSFLSDLNMSQVTSDGISFIKPYLMQYGVVAAVDSESAWDQDKIKATINEDYLSFDLYMRTRSSSRTVQLSENTYCGPIDPSASFNSTTGVLPDSVVGSLRMSVTNADDDNASRRLLWIPAPNIYYNYDTIETNITNMNNTYALKYMNGSTLENVYDIPAIQGTYHHTYWDKNKNHNTIMRGENKVTDVTANNYCDYKLHDTATIGTMDKALTGLTGYSDAAAYGSYYYDKCRFNFWFEGEDPEARAAQVGGTFKAVLEFVLGSAS